jgi:SPP1 gp7 family putative phage head morphogenesis protein
MAMYEYLDSLLAKVKKKIRTEFNRLGAMGFDELNVVNTRKTTAQMYDRFLTMNEQAYLKAAIEAYKKAKENANGVGYSGEETDIDEDWLLTILLAYNLVTGYIYDREAERKRLRLNEQILTAREYDDRGAFNDSLRRSANLWWTQTLQYGIDVVDQATLQAYRDAGVEYVRWIAVQDERTCEECGPRHMKIYRIDKAPAKTHYGCRCRLEPVKKEEADEDSGAD